MYKTKLGGGKGGWRLKNKIPSRKCLQQRKSASGGGGR